MAVLVGVASSSPVVPAGAPVGGFAVLVTNSAATPAGWAVVGRDVSWWHPLMVLLGPDAALRTGVFSRVLTAADVAPGAGPVTQLGAGFEGLVLVFDPGSSVGMVRQGLGMVRVGQGSHAVVAVPGTTSGAGLSWAGPLERTGFVWAPATSIETGVGYLAAPAPAAATVGVMSPWGVAVEVRAPVAPPAPVLSLPVNGAEVAADEPLDLAWVTPSAASGYQARIETPEGPRWWNAATQSLSETEVSNTSGVTGAVLPPAVLSPVNASRGWQVAWQRASDGKWSPYSDTSVFTPVARPVVTVTGPTGTVTDDLSPTVTWDTVMTRPASSVTAYRVTGSQGGVLVHDGGWVPAPGSEYQVPPDAGWVQGPVEVTVEVEQTGGLRSLPAEWTFALAWTPPPTPVVVAVPDSDGVRVEATGLVPGNRVQVQRSSPSGWVPVESRAALAAGEAHVDVTGLSRTEATYRVRQLGVLSGQVLPSEWGYSGPVVSPVGRWCYLWDAAAPGSTWQRVYLTGRGPVRYPQVIGKFDTLGHDPAKGRYPVARMARGVARAPEVELTFEVFSEQAVADLEGLLMEASVIGIRLPSERDLDKRALTAGSVLHVSRNNAVELAVIRNSAARQVTLACVTQDRIAPTGLPPASPVTQAVDEIP